MPTNNFEQIGRAGQKRYGGIFYEEFLKELQGKRGIEVYKEMSENDDVVGACLYAIETLLKQAKWDVEPASTATADQKAADFLKSCMDDMQESWMDFITEALSFLPFGWSYHEIVYKRRGGQSRDVKLNSKYNDGLIGWRKMPIRAQETLYKWEYDNEDNLLAMTQVTTPDFGIATIPIEKAVLFKTKSRKQNPEGRSILRNAYRSWYFKKRIQEIEGIGIERDLAGYPVLTPPEGLDLWNPNDDEMALYRARAESIVKDIRRDQLEGLVLPFGWEFKLLNSGGTRNFDTNKIVERYDTRIAMTMLADFLLIGHQQTGSFALSSDKTEMFSMAIGSYLKIIAEGLNGQAVPRLFALNEGKFQGMTGLPKFVYGDVETPNLTEISTYIKDMTGIGVLSPDENLEAFIRRTGNLPEKMEGTEDENTKPKPAPGKEDAEDDPKPDKQQQQTVKRLLEKVRGK